MPMFVQTDRVPISDDRGNTIFIKPKMDYGTRNAVMSAGADARMDEKGNVVGAKIDIGRQQNALLVHNIVDWSGPDFEGVACTPVNKLRLDPDEPLVAEVLEEIARRNPQKQAPSPKSRTASGSSSTGAADLTPSVQSSNEVSASPPS